MPTGATALCFYASLAAGIGSTIAIGRGAVERRPPPRPALGLAALAVLGLAFSLAAYAAGPRDLLPF